MGRDHEGPTNVTTLHETPDIAGPRYVARAIVELGEPAIRSAWEYISRWTVLERACVPALLRREILDPDAPLVEMQTAAQSEVFGWALGAPTAPLVLCGGVGVGKSYAGAQWLLASSRAGRGIAWSSATRWAMLPLARDKRDDDDRSRARKPILDDERARAADAQCLVLDDLGAGRLNEFVLDQINGLLLARFEHERPTLVLINAPKADAKGWLQSHFDARILDRLKAGRGKAKVLSDVKSLRASPKPDEVDGAGRGKVWHRCRRLLELVGVEDSDGRPWSPGDRVVLSPRFGCDLRSRLERLSDWITEAELVRVLCGIDAGEIAARSVEMQADELGSPAFALADSLISRMLAQLATEKRDRQAAEVKRPSGVMGTRTQTVEADPEVARIAKLRAPALNRQKLAALGVVIRHADLAGVWEVWVKAKQARRRGATKLTREQRLGDLKASGFDTENEAWEWANKLMLGAEAQPEDEHGTATAVGM